MSSKSRRPPRKPVHRENIFIGMVVMALLVGFLPLWPYSVGWGYYPVGAFGFILIAAILAMSFRRRRLN